MHILYYSWQENTTSDFLFSMQALGHQVSPCMHELSYYFSDGVKSDIRDQLQAQTYDAVFTFNFFPLVSDMAESLHIPYICWVFDCPHYTLYSNSIRNSCNYLFLFDRDMCQSAIRRGARHAFHLPLAINTARLKEQLGISSEGGLLRPDTYMHDISFVGSLYESSHYSSFRYAPNHLRGYLAGIIDCEGSLLQHHSKRGHLTGTDRSREPSGGLLFRRPLHRFRHRMLSGCSLEGNGILHRRNAGCFLPIKDQLKPHAAFHHFRHSAPRT